MKAWSPNYWTTREFPSEVFFKKHVILPMLRLGKLRVGWGRVVTAQGHSVTKLQIQDLNWPMLHSLGVWETERGPLLTNSRD